MNFKLLGSLSCLLLLSACSFVPMAAKNETDTNATGARLVIQSEAKDGGSYPIQMMRHKLKNALIGLNLDASYKINVIVKEETGNLAYSADATSKRSMTRLNARIIITHDYKTVYETTLNAVTSYSQTENDEFVNQSAAVGAQERLIESLTLDVARELQKFSKIRSQLNV